MARFTFSNSTYQGAEGYAFAGFDEIGGECVEATHASALGKVMCGLHAKYFASLKPGQRQRVASGNFFFREY